MCSPAEPQPAIHCGYEIEKISLHASISLPIKWKQVLPTCGNTRIKSVITHEGSRSFSDTQ